MLKVCDVISSPVISVNILDSVGKAAFLMEKHGIGGLPVLDNEKLCGIITSRDVRRTHPNRIVADAMSKDVIYVSKDVFLCDAIEIIEDKKIERLPVLENSRLVGIITKTDILVEMGRHTDPLTNLKTGPYIRALAENILKQGKELTVVFFDLNDFGLINKTYGHVHGDRCLKIISRILNKNTLNSLYFPGRYAGDEFIVVTTEKKETAGAWAAKVVEEMANATKEEGVPITVAAGIAGGQRNGVRKESHFSATVDDLINMASLASAFSKKNGQSVAFWVSSSKMTSL
ncbi:CBS domain-containing protein [Pelotomaculum propionicicum]|uniref:Hypoxic response protein 1 n=1 Tax=Pelotomaculum propionicicum TaxID=258475 RepID=A0A4Y7RX78_9FIRM|nr:GGDEF domain-containing protein [Pelotomaculum propionicicum]TEB13453.1 Hypoxic response protein 1 [Pelotomaculum propionicicum]